MRLYDALVILARVHTESDSCPGFVVHAGAHPSRVGIGTSEYIEAWRVVRVAAGMEPEVCPAMSNAEGRSV